MYLMIRNALLTFTALLMASCSDNGLNGNTIPGLATITIDPANQTLTINGTTPAMSDYRATGHFMDGHMEDLTARTVFTLLDASLATFTGAHFTSQTDHGGKTQIFAAAGSLQGSTDVTLVLRQRANDPRSMNLPPDPSAPFGGPPVAGRAPGLVYPNDGVLVPPNLQKLEFHFTPGMNNTLFELALTNATTDVKIYLRCATAVGMGCVYLPDSAVWHWIANTNRGGAPLQVSLRGTDDTGTGVGTSNMLSVSFSQDDINGALYYWTTSGDSGIMRFDFGSTTQTAATKFVGTQLTGGTCVGCHALSRDGSKLVAEAGGQNDGRILLLDVASQMPMVPFAQPEKTIFEAWNPSGSAYVGVYGDSGATDYRLMLLDGGTGAKMTSIANTGTSAHPADHPDWSPDGQKIAYVKVGTANTLQKMYGGAIELVTDMGGGAWSAPVELAPALSGKNRYYPSFARDNSFLVFDESTCSGGQNISCNADTDASAKLFALLPMAGATPVALAHANAPGLADGSSTNLTNSFPKWSPFVFQRTSEAGSRLMWLTFSSTRNYGLRPPPASPNGGTESPTGTLIWMVAIDPDKVALGMDPSYAAFALPFQDITTSNHIAQWAERAVGGMTGTCVGAGQACSASSGPCCDQLQCSPSTNRCEYLVP